MSGSRYWYQGIKVPFTTASREENLPLNHLELVSLVSHPPDGCQDRQEEVLLQPEDV